MPSHGDAATPGNFFALVTYVPAPLGPFLDTVRRKLVPGSVPRAHVTILPPRPLSASIGETAAWLDSALASVQAFELEAAEVDVFDLTSVIYLGIAQGRAELKATHQLLNSGPLEFEEPFIYHPHITVAQDLSPHQVPALSDEARALWAGFQGSRTFPVSTLAFVQNTDGNRWLDLARWTLSGATLPADR